MILTSLLFIAPPLAAAPPAPLVQELVAIKARRVEIGNGEVLEHAVILIDDGQIVTMGQDLPIERGIPVIELDDDQVVMPGLVNPYSRIGMSGNVYNDSRGNILASSELYPANEDYGKVLEAGTTTLAQYPAGVGVPGQAVIVRPKGATAAAMTIRDSAYLKIVMRASSSNKRNIRDGFKKADDHAEKVAKEREKWEKKNKPAKKTSTKKADDKAGDDKAGDEKAADEKKTTSKSSSKKKVEPFVPPEPDPRVKPFIEMREGTLQALVSISDAAAYEHLVDAFGDEKVEWHLRIPLSRDIDVFHVKEKVGERACFVLTDPTITLQPGTMRQRNLPAEFERAGAKLVLLPRSDSVRGHESWLQDVGVLIGAGLERAAAVRAVTQNPARFLGLGETHGTLEEGKRANLVVYSGDPFEPGSEVDAVMLDGEFVHGEIYQ